ncbi:MAG: DUF3089 domain-containing protein [Sphingomonas bacterium]|nr:DUF3089 domain-containing protein [Sphingomonas bacterium]
MLARRFLGCVFLLTLLAVLGAFLFYQFGASFLVRQATPQGHFQAPAASDSGPDYADSANWLSKPVGGLNLAEWRPDLPDGTPAPPPILRPRNAATFYIHPTTYLERARWNAPLVPDATSEGRTQTFVRSQASAFNEVSDVWAPRYRQAAFGAFLLKSADATQALDLAYRDVLMAFDAFLAAQPAGKPLILAGHSQGALHLSRLLADRRAMLKGRLVAAYVVGWPLSATADLPAMGRTACASPEETGCILSWQSFAEPANPALVMDSWVGTRGANGRVRQRRDMVCVNPLTGTSGGAARPSANLGTLVPSADYSTATSAPGTVGARCDNGLLLVDGSLPRVGGFVLPGNNYHPFDYALFWGSIRADAARRLAAFRATR